MGNNNSFEGWIFGQGPGDNGWVNGCAPFDIYVDMIQSVSLGNLGPAFAEFSAPDDQSFAPGSQAP